MMNPGQKTLVIIRHAKAERMGPDGDEARQLTDRGQKQAAQLGPLLAGMISKPNLALVSTAARTRETSDLLIRGLATDDVRYVDELYGASASDALDIINTVADDVDTLVIVGHEPTMSSLAARLNGANGPRADEVSMGVRTATAVVMTTTGSWADLRVGEAQIKELARPAV